MKLHLSPMISKARETELGRPRTNRLPSEARLVLRPGLAGHRPAPGPSRYFASRAPTHWPQCEHVTMGWLSQPHFVWISVSGGGLPLDSQRSPNCMRAMKLG